MTTKTRFLIKMKIISALNTQRNSKSQRQKVCIVTARAQNTEETTLHKLREEGAGEASHQPPTATSGQSDRSEVEATLNVRNSLVSPVPRPFAGQSRGTPKAEASK